MVGDGDGERMTGAQHRHASKTATAPSIHNGQAANAPVGINWPALAACLTVYLGSKSCWFMENALPVAGFVLIVIIAAVLFMYVVTTKRRKATQLYRAASREESMGNYTEAINLYETYLKENADDGQQVVYKIKTLRALISQ